MAGYMKRLKRYFLTGLIILAPVALTFAIILFIFNLLTVPFAGAVTAIFDRYNMLDTGFLFLSGRETQELVSQILVLIFLGGFTVLLGAVARHFFINSFIKTWDYLLNKIPVISSIYKTSQEVIKTIFGNTANSFKQVVMVKFPSPETYSLGFVTRENVEGLVPDKTFITVFVPTAPNPTSGFLMLYQPEDLIYLDMKVDEAFKYVVSCGMVTSPFSVMTKEPVEIAHEEIKKAKGKGKGSKSS